MQNYKVYCSLNNVPIDESLAGISTGDDDVMMDSGDVEMDVDGDGDVQVWNLWVNQAFHRYLLGEPL